jgi:hypothetical protein
MGPDLKRIESEVLRNLRREAGQKDISTNTLVNKLIKDHLNWHSNAAKAGFISVRRPFISKIIKYLPEQEIISLAEYVAKTTNKDSILLMKNEYTIKSAQDLLAKSKEDPLACYMYLSYISVR